MVQKFQTVKVLLDEAILTCKVQPVGCGYIDCITTKDNIVGFVDSLSKIGITISSFTWWCHCAIGGNKNTDCPHGGGGPRSKFFDGYFSEIYQIPNIKVANNCDVLSYIFDEWPNQDEYLPCLIPGFWLDVPDHWRNIIDI